MSTLLNFDDPLSSTDPNGVVGRGGSLNADLLIDAYARGIFPWPQQDGSVLWISPLKRGILRLDEFYVSKQVAKEARASSFRVTFNKDFSSVINRCKATQRKGQTFTWITDQITSAYGELHQKGFAHSLECWEGEELVGGLYGVWNGRMFTGESMFFAKSSASKICLIALVENLKSFGLRWIDIQIVSQYLGRVGGKLIEREEFYRELNLCQARDTLPWPKYWTPAHVQAQSPDDNLVAER